MAVRLGARCCEELRARGRHSRVRTVEVLDMKEETHPPGGLPADDGGLVLAVSPREQQAGRGTGWPACHPPAWDARRWCGPENPPQARSPVRSRRS